MNPRALLFVVLVALGSVARGDVTVTSKMQSEMGGKLSVELTQVDKFQGPRSRQERLAHVNISTRSVDNHRGTLTQLDKGLIIELDFDKQTHKQQTVQETREKMQQVLGQMRKLELGDGPR